MSTLHFLCAQLGLGWSQTPTREGGIGWGWPFQSSRFALQWGLGNVKYTEPQNHTPGSGTLVFLSNDHSTNNFVLFEQAQIGP
jgi:hypothetical protein